jgi:spermidine synthase
LTVVAVFFVSGIPALIYQLVWQRALFTMFGINIEAVTAIGPSR